MKDYFDLENAVLGGQTPVPGQVSYRVEWTAAGPVNEFDNVAQQFRGSFRDASARMEWSARSADYDLRPRAPLRSWASSATAGSTDRSIGCLLTSAFGGKVQNLRPL